MLGDLSPGERASVDQTLALAWDVEAAWPHNQRLLADSECERVVLERLGEPWAEMRADRSYLLWANGRMVAVEPDPLVIASTAFRTSPDFDTSECDRCPIQGVAGVAVVACPRNLVPLLLCACCADELDHDLFITGGAA